MALIHHQPDGDSVALTGGAHYRADYLRQRKLGITPVFDPIITRKLLSS